MEKQLRVRYCVYDLSGRYSETIEESSVKVASVEEGDEVADVILGEIDRKHSHQGYKFTRMIVLEEDGEESGLFW